MQPVRWWKLKDTLKNVQRKTMFFMDISFYAWKGFMSCNIYVLYFSTSEGLLGQTRTMTMRWSTLWCRMKHASNFDQTPKENWNWVHWLEAQHAFTELSHFFIIYSNTSFMLKQMLNFVKNTTKYLQYCWSVIQCIIYYFCRWS